MNLDNSSWVSRIRRDAPSWWTYTPLCIDKTKSVSRCYYLYPRQSRAYHEGDNDYRLTLSFYALNKYISKSALFESIVYNIHILMNKLYIIGNGFDLKHGLPSRYSDFAEFCKKINWELYEQLTLLFPKISGESLWSNFEKGLGEVDESILRKKFYEPYKKNCSNDKFLNDFLFFVISKQKTPSHCDTVF